MKQILQILLWLEKQISINSASEPQILFEEMSIILIFLVKVWVESGLASTEKSGDNLLIHHSRNTEQKQWSETQVSSFHSSLGD